MGRLTGKKMSGTGGELLVAQAKAAGVRYLFSNPGSAEAAFFDALVDAPESPRQAAAARSRTTRPPPARATWSRERSSR